MSTEWYGVTVTAVRGTAVIKVPTHYPSPWHKAHGGERRKVVRVDTPGGERFYLDDETCLGWEKLTHGGGSDYLHRAVRIDEESFEVTP